MGVNAAGCFKCAGIRVYLDKLLSITIVMMILWSLIEAIRLAY
jgi:hypothetical protein